MSKGSKKSKDTRKALKTQTAKEIRKPATKVTPLLLMFIILIVSLAVYFNALFNGFVFDDAYEVLQNRWIKDIKYIPDIFTQAFWGFRGGEGISNYYRPLKHIVYMLTYHLFGLTPWGFHLVNMLLHAAVSISVFLIISKLLREHEPPGSASSGIPPFIAAIVFAVHPIHTEAVTWVASAQESSFALFYLLSFYFYLRFKEGLKGSYLLSIGMFLLAVFFKEPALTLPIVLIVYDSIFRKPEERVDFRRYIPYLVVVAVYMVMRSHALAGFAPLKRHVELGTYGYIINVFPLFAQYLEKLLFPVNLNAWYVLHPIASLFDVRGIIALVVTAGFIAAAVIALRKNKVAFFALLLIVVPLLPVLYIPGVGENTFAERYLYLPSFGFVVLVALFLTWTSVKFPKWRVGLRAVFVVLIGLYCIGTVSRNTVWKDNYSLWTDTAQKSPDSAEVRSDLGVEYNNRGQIDHAIEQFQIAIRLKPDYAYPYNNLGTSYRAKGLIDHAIGQYQIAIRLKPDDAETYNNLGNAYAVKGLKDRAIEEFKTSLKIRPDSGETYHNLGNAYMEKGLLDEATVHYQNAIRLKPDIVEAHNNLGTLYFKKGRIDEAIEQFQIAVRLKSTYAKALYNLGKAYAVKGLIDQAIEHLAMAVRLSPSDQSYRNALADAYKMRNPLTK